MKFLLKRSIIYWVKKEGNSHTINVTAYYPGQKSHPIQVSHIKSKTFPVNWEKYVLFKRTYVLIDA